MCLASGQPSPFLTISGVTPEVSKVRFGQEKRLGHEVARIENVPEWGVVGTGSAQLAVPRFT